MKTALKILGGIVAFISLLLIGVFLFFYFLICSTLMGGGICL